MRTAVHLQSALWALISVLTFVPLVAGDIAADLENALADKANMTIYRSLIKVSSQYEYNCFSIADTKIATPRHLQECVRRSNGKWCYPPLLRNKD